MSKQARLYGRKGPFARDMVARHEEFHAGAMRGEREVSGAYQSSGRLPDQYRPEWYTMTADPETQEVTDTPHRFVVFSYGTPIGWVTASGEVVVPDTSYSVTTSRHQGIVRAYLHADARPSAWDNYR